MGCLSRRLSRALRVCVQPRASASTVCPNDKPVVYRLGADPQKVSVAGDGLVDAPNPVTVRAVTRDDAPPWNVAEPGVERLSVRGVRTMRSPS